MLIKSKKRVQIILAIIFFLLFLVGLNCLKDNNFFTVNQSNNLTVSNLQNLYQSNVQTDTVLIFEPNSYHYECTPGYVKYFMDLGFNVDLVADKKCQDSLEVLNPTKQIRIFNYDNLNEVSSNCEKLNSFFKKYKYILIETTDPSKKDLYEKLGFLDMKNSIFVAHDTEFIKNMGMSEYYDQNRVTTLGNFKDGIQVNPHYFGNIKLKNKNEKTKFFITSSSGRNYSYLVDAADKLKKEGLDFNVVVSGWNTQFSDKDIPEHLRNDFIFKHGLSYKDLYSEVEDADYIIINLDPNNSNDNAFKNLRVSGSAQLAYGFSKPALIDKNFANIYGMNSDNSFIFDGSSFYDAMREAILLNNDGYKLKQNNLIKLSSDIYNCSLDNLKYILKNIK